MTNNPAGSMKAASGEPPSRKKKEIPTPEVEAENGCYRTPEGYVAIRAQSIIRCMIEAGKQIQHPTNKRATATKLFAAALFPPEQELLPIRDEDSIPLT